MSKASSLATKINWYNGNCVQRRAGEVKGSLLAASCDVARCAVDVVVSARCDPPPPLHCDVLTVSTTQHISFNISQQQGDLCDTQMSVIGPPVNTPVHLFFGHIVFANTTSRKIVRCTTRPVEHVRLQRCFGAPDLRVAQ